MNADDLTPTQAQHLAGVIRRQLAYLTRLTQRMDRLGWERRDPLYRAAVDAQRAMHALSVHLHYAAVRDGVYRPAPEKNQPSP